MHILILFSNLAISLSKIWMVYFMHANATPNLFVWRARPHIVFQNGFVFINISASGIRKSSRAVYFINIKKNHINIALLLLDLHSHAKSCCFSLLKSSTQRFWRRSVAFNSMMFADGRKYPNPLHLFAPVLSQKHIVQ